MSNFKERGKESGYIDVLDGIRAAAILIIVWFHFWQQSWIMPIGFGVNLDWLPRTGAVQVDMLLMLSGFCLFLPHARNMIMGENLGGTKDFYVRRLVRIMPSYLIAIAVALFAFALPMGDYASSSAMYRDIFSHLTFTHVFFPDTFYTTNLNGALWTLAVEMQFYLIFPIIAWFFKKRPAITFGVMVCVSLIYNQIIVRNMGRVSFGMLAQQLPTYLAVYAVGMMAALIVVSVQNIEKPAKYQGFACTALAVFSVYLYIAFMKNLCSVENARLWQVENRLPLAIVFGIFIIGTVFATGWFRWIFANKGAVFLSGISFNLYIWHQYLSVKIKDLRIPYWSGEVPPNKLGDEPWKWKYFILIWVVAFAAAILGTYLIERPCTAWLMKKWRGRKSQNKLQGQ